MAGQSLHDSTVTATKIKKKGQAAEVAAYVSSHTQKKTISS